MKYKNFQHLEDTLLRSYRTTANRTVPEEENNGKPYVHRLFQKLLVSFYKMTQQRVVFFFLS